jgi:hypothetical protein
MSKKDLRVNDYLDHILQAIERIERSRWVRMKRLSCKTSSCKMR